MSRNARSRKRDLINTIDPRERERAVDLPCADRLAISIPLSECALPSMKSTRCPDVVVALGVDVWIKRIFQIPPLVIERGRGEGTRKSSFDVRFDGQLLLFREHS